MTGWVDSATREPVDRRGGIDTGGCEDDEDYDEDDDLVENAETRDAEGGAAEPVWDTYLDARYVCTDPGPVRAPGPVARA